MAPNLETLNVETLWRPHPGPQTVFLAAGEFEALYGGAAGGGVDFGPGHSGRHSGRLSFSPGRRGGVGGAGAWRGPESWESGQCGGWTGGGGAS